ncbi:MAG: MFS transporter [bacterium]|nr:MFS transporter [bacterium]
MKSVASCSGGAPQSVKPDTPLRRNTLALAATESFWGFNTAAVASATVLTTLLQRHGATAAFLGAIPALEFGGILLPQVIGTFFFHQRQTLKRRIIIWHVVGILPCLFILAAVCAAAPRLPAVAVRWLLLSFFGLFACSIGVVAAAWSDWLGHLFPARMRGRAIGIAMCASSLCGAAGALLSGRILAADHTPRTYALLYVLAGIAAALSVSCMLFLKDEPALVPASIEPAPRAPLRQLLRSFHDGQYVCLLIVRVLMLAGLSLMPFVAVYFTSAAGGGLSDATVVSCGAAMTIGAALCSLASGWIGDHLNHKCSILVSIGAQCAGTLLLTCMHGQLVCLLVYACLGAASAGGYLSSLNLVIDSCRHDARLAHITAANVVVGVAAMGIPLLGGWYAQVHGVPALFRACLWASGAALLWCVVVLRDPRRA